MSSSSTERGGPAPRTSRRRWWIRRARSFVGAGLLIAAWFTFLAPVGLGGPVSVIWVNGTSMEPTLFSGDLAVLYQRESYAVGDIVAFEIPEGGNVIHRVTDVRSGNYRFRGDNRDRDDPWSLPAQAILGREVFRVPGAARVLGVLAQPIVLGLLVAALVLVLTLRPEATAAPSLGPGYLDWGRVPGTTIRLMPSPRRHRRRQRAQALMARHRAELRRFQEWPARSVRV